MKIIALLAVISMLLVDLFGTKSSVGGPMTDLLILFLIMLAIGIYMSWSRGPLAWVVNIVLALVGGFLAVTLCGMLMEAILTQIHFQGALAKSNHPMRYISVVGMALSAVLGAWLPIQVVNRLRN